MGVVRSGTQYRQDPRVRRADISLFGAWSPRSAPVRGESSSS